MGYHTGSITSIATLSAAITAALVADGWVVNGSVYSHGTKAIRFTSETYRLNAFFGVADGSGAMTNESTYGVSFAMRSDAGTVPFVFPAPYHILISDNEVYVGVRFNVVGASEYWQWMSFGIASGFPIGEGHFLSGPTLTYRAQHTSMVVGSQSVQYNTISTTTQSTSTSDANNMIRPPFVTGSNTLVRASFGGTLQWFNPVLTNGTGKYNSGSVIAATAVYYTPGQHLLTPMLAPVVFGRVADADGTFKLKGRLANCRYVRTDYHEPGDTIVLGGDTWRIFPIMLRNLTSVGGNTVGLAIKV